MSAWASAAPVIGTGSLDGFAIGALMSGACALAITAPRRARRLSAARSGAQAAERMGWLCQHVMAAEAVGFGLAAEAVGFGLAAEADRTRHRRGDSVPGRAPRDRVSPGSASEQGAFPRSVALQSPFPGTAPPRTAFADSVFPRSGFAGGRSPRDAHPDVEFSGAELALVPLASPRRPEARRQPRHAAPSVGLGSRISGFASRMTGLVATRALASGARV